MDINSRIRTIRENLSDGSNKKFADTLGKSPQYTSNICRPGKSVGSDVLDEILSKYPVVSEEWLKLGIGNILKTDNRDVSIFAPEDLPLEVGRLYRAPIFESYPVSAGDMGLSAVRNQKPDGYAYTTMPGVTFFPIVGCSFEPIIKAGHYVGTVKLDSWDRLDTEKIYFILTREERMIKRLRIDESDESVLWCVSPNFREFKINKQDILEISHVFFYGMMI